MRGQSCSASPLALRQLPLSRSLLMTEGLRQRPPGREPRRECFQENLSARGPLSEKESPLAPARCATREYCPANGRLPATGGTHRLIAPLAVPTSSAQCPEGDRLAQAHPRDARATAERAASARSAEKKDLRGTCPPQPPPTDPHSSAR